MGKQTSLAERLQISQLAGSGLTDPQIVQQVGYSRWTVRKWRRRHQATGRAGLQSRLGRPRRGALSSYPASVSATLLAWRQQHPGWGAKTLRTELAGDERFKAQRLPSLRSINRFLDEQQLLARQQHHVELPQPERQTAQAVHDEWEIDARGHAYIPQVGVVELINLNDSYSRTRLLSYPLVLGQQRLSRRATTADYQLVLRLAFTDWGVPGRLASDHHRLFYDGKSKSPFPTRLHLWLLALGISLEFGHFHCPTDQAITERSHQLWAKQVLQGQQFDDWHQLFAALQKRREFLNDQLPCASLDERPPLVAYPDSRFNPRLYRPEWEAELLDPSRIHHYLAQGRWFRLTSNVGAFSLGGHTYCLDHNWAKQEVELTFDPDDLHLVVHSAAGQHIKRFFLKGITPLELLGELQPLTQLPAFQLALPFTWSEWRAARLSDTLRGMT